jgi:branched-chain amino acid transport system permease protein
VGGCIFGLLPETLRSLEIGPEVQWVIYGVLMVLLLYFLPQGIVPALRGWWQARRGAPARAAPPQASVEAAQ